jgi:hypothetical protein
MVQVGTFALEESHNSCFELRRKEGRWIVVSCVARADGALAHGSVHFEAHSFLKFCLLVVRLEILLYISSENE